MTKINKWWNQNIDKDISNLIIKLKCKLSGKEIDRDWTEDLSLNYEDLDNDMEKMPSVLAFWSAVLAEARREKSIIEMKLNIRKGKVLEGVKELLSEGIKMTVQDKENMVNLDERYKAIQMKLIDQDATVSKLFGIVEALKVKADNLRSFSAMKRAELNNS
jgi:hypothetical protein